MKIDPIKIAGLYESNSNKNMANNKIKNDMKHPNDRIEISDKGSMHKEIASLKSIVINEIDKGASAERIQRLKTEIENGTYNVSGIDIADAMTK